MTVAARHHHPRRGGRSALGVCRSPDHNTASHAGPSPSIRSGRSPSPARLGKRLRWPHNSGQAGDTALPDCQGPTVHLRIVSYNIHRAIGVDRRFRLERIAHILKHIDADIALLQEVDSGAPRSRELDLGRELAEVLGYPHYAIGHNVTLRKGRYGNATLSRFPILRERNIDLTIGGRKRRGCQHTRIELRSGVGRVHPLEVFNVHLGLSARERARQIGLLARSHEFSGLDAAQACLVGGDFNDWRSLLPPMLTEVLGFDCATDRHNDCRRPIRTFPAFSPTGGLDKIFYRGPVRALGARACHLGVSRVASDHLPIIVEFELGG